MFRSIIIPIKAIILNLILVGAAYGILVMVFQKGWIGESLLDFIAVGIIEIFMPRTCFLTLIFPKGTRTDGRHFVPGSKPVDGPFSSDSLINMLAKKVFH